IELKYAPGSGLMKSSVPQPVTGLYREQGMRLSSVVGNHTFSVRDKIILAHTVAQAFWQLYASELMRCLWTSDNVWFMREDNDGTPRDALPMKAYISFDFGDAPHTVPEFLESSPQDLTHRFPHVLALGILLLEIALGSKVRVSEFTDISHITSNHTKAHQKWRDLKETKWDGFSLHMSHLINAIGHCLDFKKVWHGKSGTKLDQKKPTDLGARRDLLYEKVVKPLAWLAAAFHEDSENVTYPYKDITYLLPCPNEEKLRPAVNFEPKSSLFSPNRTNTHWLSEIKTINGYVREQLRARQGKLKEAESEKDHSLIKVAILDTGYNPDLDFFKREGRQNRIKWKDFVDTEQDAKSDLKSNAVDDHGHGSFMTKLVMDTAPLADIYAVRVAKDNDSIHHKNERIAEAIRWAGLDKEARVDVISMSFAFEAELEDVKEISAAIAAVRSGRDDKVIFLAAAGNFGVEQSDMFPAWHQDVIAIHAADSRGKFLETDPVPMKKSEPEFGTIGDDLPSYFTEEIAKFYPKLNTDGGSSIATAVAAGMIATTLIHADLLPYLPSRLDGFQVPLQRLRMKPGMERALALMTKGKAADKGRRFFNLVWLWKSAQRENSPLDYNIGMSLQTTLMAKPFP
ncbi:peptidase S8/S53 domain-containing protein, partial [Ilyonectria sp. MPI-CAGE-AT-0026]